MEPASLTVSIVALIISISTFGLNAANARRVANRALSDVHTNITTGIVDDARHVLTLLKLQTDDTYGPEHIGAYFQLIYAIERVTATIEFACTTRQIAIFKLHKKHAKFLAWHCAAIVSHLDWFCTIATDLDAATSRAQFEVNRELLRDYNLLD
ncbi:hypothetical protein R4P64_26530 [Rhodococcus sp. IEGM 1366]|uniref:hypothetical protein n=1 Tax=Rhodococcus sp. IEGM 1366 TaxID=3082223 RepID=UPI002953E1DA|nr:hypothetical protein [Rhodococcus sp. IEGM 1366]MDV8070090.1 hypothetical protein [Rhodococcus sp. IEGM 1366]